MAEPHPTSPPSGPRRRSDPPGRRADRAQRPETRGPSTTNDAQRSPRRSWRSIPAPVLWAGGGMALLLVALAILIAVFQWNWLRGPID